MGTKATEAESGCYARAMDDEPMFVLLARDPHAPALTRDWADKREADVRVGKRPASDLVRVADARRTADYMEDWRTSNDGAWRAKD